MFCPYFCPMSVLGTCCVIGRINTILEKEQEMCCEMGPKGWLCCFVSNALLGPPGFLLCGLCLRTRVMTDYNVQGGTSEWLQGICFPCSYFQMLVSLKEWEAEKVKSAVVANPVYTPPTAEAITYK